LFEITINCFFRTCFHYQGFLLSLSEQLAQIEEMALRTLLFVEVKGRAAGAPFLNEVLGCHVGAARSMRAPKCKGCAAASAHAPGLRRAKNRPQPCFKSKKVL
jgi:hypothetical protein